MLPNDPMICLGFINTKLRDEFKSLEELCDVLNISPQEVKDKLAAIDYFYDPKLNKFV